MASGSRGMEVGKGAIIVTDALTASSVFSVKNGGAWQGSAYHWHLTPTPRSEATMPVWYRVFAAAEAEPGPAAILEFLNGLTVVRGDFGGDAAGWFRADLIADDAPLHVERFLVSEEGVRAELNSWAAHVEAGGDPRGAGLMERLIQTRQLFTLERSDEATAADPLCVALCRFLARAVDDVYQIDGRGFFAADGTPLLAE